MKKCKYCDKELVFKQYEIDNHSTFTARNFCGHSCAAKYNKVHLVPKNQGIKTKELWASPQYKQHMKDVHKDKKQSKETIEKRVSKLRGELNYNWKGGCANPNTKIRKSWEYKLWRTAVFERDNYTCVFCGAHNGKGKAVKLNADHIKPFSIYPELRFVIENGRTLCVGCHKETDTYGGKLCKKSK
jgi:hypothetical protein